MPSPDPRGALCALCLIAATVVALAWGALAFGSVYRWAYTPLAIGAAVLGLLDLIGTSKGRPPLRDLTIGLLAIGVAIGVQLVPLPQQTLERDQSGRSWIFTRV